MKGDEVRVRMRGQCSGLHYLLWVCCLTLRGVKYIALDFGKVLIGSPNIDQWCLGHRSNA